MMLTLFKAFIKPGLARPFVPSRHRHPNEGTTTLALSPFMSDGRPPDLPWETAGHPGAEVG